ncbi:MAG: DUF3540 domain-containing protein [Gammaproteobacteria bacterium]|nr:DUF3540 domain-containing protein [Gammaproteobacteria bacterium]
MFHVLNEHCSSENNVYVQTAVINDIAESNLCNVEFTLNGVVRQSWAMLAIPAYQPSVGHRVLVTGECINECYIIGVLPSTKTVKKADRMVSTTCGALARVTQKNNEECLQVEDERGQLLFEYRPGQGTGVLSMPEGDLALHAPKGNIQLVSGKSVVCSSIGPMVFESASGIDLCVKTNKAKSTSVRLFNNTLGLSSERLGVQAQNANIQIEKANYYGKTINGTVEYAKWVYQKLENIVERLFERARNVYRHTEELHQTKAGRMRTLVDGDYHLKSEAIDVRAEETVKIDGKKIHLG